MRRTKCRCKQILDIAQHEYRNKIEGLWMVKIPGRGVRRGCRAAGWALRHSLTLLAPRSRLLAARAVIRGVLSPPLLPLPHRGCRIQEELAHRGVQLPGARAGRRQPRPAPVVCRQQLQEVGQRGRKHGAQQQAACGAQGGGRDGWWRRSQAKPGNRPLSPVCLEPNRMPATGTHAAAARIKHGAPA